MLAKTSVLIYNEDWRLENFGIELVNEYRYLGTMLELHPDQTIDINRRIKMARAAFIKKKKEKKQM